MNRYQAWSRVCQSFILAAIVTKLADLAITAIHNIVFYFTIILSYYYIDQAMLTALPQTTRSEMFLNSASSERLIASWDLGL